MEDNEKITIEFIRLSKNREKVFRALEGETLKPTDISKKTGIHRNNVSRTLSQLKEKDLVRLLNPENKRGRLYEYFRSKRKLFNGNRNVKPCDIRRIKPWNSRDSKRFRRKSQYGKERNYRICI